MQIATSGRLLFTHRSRTHDCAAVALLPNVSRNTDTPVCCVVLSTSFVPRSTKSHHVNRSPGCNKDFIEKHDSAQRWIDSCARLFSSHIIQSIYHPNLEEPLYHTAIIPIKPAPMTGPIEADTLFRATLDHSLVRVTFEPGSISKKVETDIEAVVDKHVNFENPTPSFIIYKFATQSTRRVIEAWRTLQPSPDGSISKMDCAFTLRSFSQAVKSPIDGEILSCMATPFHGVEGGFVPQAGLEEIVQASSKLYLLISDKVQAQELELSQMARERYSTPLKKPTAPALATSETGKVFKSIRIASPKSRGYDALFPTFAGDLRDVLSPGKKNAPARLTPQKAKPQRSYNKRNGKGAVGEAQQKIENFSEPVPAIAQGIGASTYKKTRRKTELPTNSPSASPSKSATMSRTPSKSAASGQRRGNFGHGNLAPWQKDEVDFVKDLITITQGGMKWQDIANATNEVVRNKPTIKKDGTVVPRGGRGIQGLRQHMGIQRFRACLLYTSPSPRDGLLSRMPSSA